jgi:hypothetical protein
MDGEVEHPVQQAEEALREAIRKIEGGACPKCGRTDPHGDESHWTTGPISYPECSNGPDCQCPFHWHMRAQDDRIRELELRRLRREIADQHLLDNLLPDDGWHPGTCTGCRMDDEPVKGPPGAELCGWCDQLRILAPAPASPPPPARRSFIQDMLAITGSSSFMISAVLIFTGTMLMVGGHLPLGAAVWLAGMLWPNKR